ncbi:MAG: OmpA family protein [Desulfobacteraceae bacterium]|jgi:outer membrane protein OmpA-like peptidoglycan-associated protein
MNSKFFKCCVLSTGLIFSVTACSTVNPYTGEKQASKLAVGAGIGAAGGAIVGLMTADSKDRQKNALIGAGLGALAGGSIGYYMDVQEAKLRQRLQNSGVSVTRIGDQIMLNMPGNVTFATGSPNINASFYEVLNSVAVVLKEYEKTTVDVIGHTDSVGAEDYNQRLSEKRARSVAEYLSSQGTLPARLLIAGMGEAQPIASNATPEGRAQNRRVNLQISPLTAQ